MSDESLMKKDYVWADDETLEGLQDDIALADAGQGWHRIGKLNIGLTRFIKWMKGQPVAIEADEWKRTPASQRGFDFVFDVDIAEFDQRAKDEGWNYERRVTFKGRDWFNILVPSVEEVLGDGSMSAKNYMATIGGLRGAYVDLLDVSQSPGKDGKIPKNENTGKPYTTCKLIKVFKSREEAQAAYNELRQDGDEAVVAGDHYPATWSTDIQGMIDHVKQLKEQGQSDLEIAKAALLLDADSSPVVSIKGDNVDAAQVLAEIFDVPVPTIKL